MKEEYTLSKYLKARKCFEESYNLTTAQDFGYINLHLLKYRMRHFELFLNIYYHDRKPHLSNIVSSIDRRKRFYVNGTPVLKICIRDRNYSIIDKYPEQFSKILIHATKQLTNNGRL